MKQPSILPPPASTRPSKLGTPQTSASQVRAILDGQRHDSHLKTVGHTPELLPPPFTDDDWSSLSILGILPANDVVRPPVGVFVSAPPPFTTCSTNPRFPPPGTSQLPMNSNDIGPRSTLPAGVLAPVGSDLNPIAVGSILPQTLPNDHAALLKTNPGIGDEPTQQMNRDELENELAKIQAAVEEEEQKMTLAKLTAITQAPPQGKLSPQVAPNKSSKPQAIFDLDAAPWEESRSHYPSLSIKNAPSIPTPYTWPIFKNLKKKLDDVRTTLRGKITVLLQTQKHFKVLPKITRPQNPKHTFGLALLGSLTMGLVIGFIGAQEFSTHQRADNLTTTRLTPRRSHIYVETRTNTVSEDQVVTNAITSNYFNVHRITLRPDGMPATIASAIKGYLLKDYRRTHPDFHYQNGTAHTMAHELQKLAPHLLRAIHYDAQVGDTLTFGTTASGEIVLTSYTRRQRELLSQPITFGPHLYNN